VENGRPVRTPPEPCKSSWQPIVRIAGFLLAAFGGINLAAAFGKFADTDFSLFDIPSLLNLLSAALSLAFGIFGIVQAGNRARAYTFIGFGVVVANIELVILIFTLIDMNYRRPLYEFIYSIVYGIDEYRKHSDVNKFYTASAFIGFGISVVLPALYIIGGSMLKKSGFRKPKSD
jgi:hypothetical protein